MTVKHLRSLLFLTLGWLASLSVAAQNDDDELPRTEPLSWMERSELKHERQYVDELARLNFGRPVRGDTSDIRLLQRIVDRELIPAEEVENLQALGAVLGDVYVAEHGLEWRAYIDEKGRSRAVCVGDTINCIFPITMLSRRMKVGIQPDVEAVMQKGLAAVAPYMPSSPFDD